jgi:hypothetical protein
VTLGWSDWIFGTSELGALHSRLSRIISTASGGMATS